MTDTVGAICLGNVSPSANTISTGGFLPITARLHIELLQDQTSLKRWRGQKESQRNGERRSNETIHHLVKVSYQPLK